MRPVGCSDSMADPADHQRRPRLTLSRLVIAIALFGIAAGILRFAAFHPRAMLAWTGVCFLVMSIGVVTRRPVISFATVFALAIISWIMTAYIGSGDFRPCEVRITIVDESDQPISGAAITAFDNRGLFRSEYLPFANLRDSEVASDSSGRIVVQQDDTIRYSSHGWALFWCIPIGNSPPDVWFSVAHFDFVTEQFGFRQIRYAQPTRKMTSIPTAFGYDVEALLVEHTVVMKRR